MFRKILKYQISWKSLESEPSFPMRTDGRKDMTKLIDTFRNCTNAPKNYSCILVSTDPPNSNPVYLELNLLVIMNCRTSQARSVESPHNYWHNLFIISFIIMVWSSQPSLHMLLCFYTWHIYSYINTFAASYLNTQGLNNSCLKSPESTLVDVTFQSRALRSFSLNQLRNLSL